MERQTQLFSCWANCNDQNPWPHFRFGLVREIFLWRAHVSFGARDVGVVEEKVDLHAANVAYLEDFWGASRNHSGIVFFLLKGEYATHQVDFVTRKNIAHIIWFISIYLVNVYWFGVFLKHIYKLMYGKSFLDILYNMICVFLNLPIQFPKKLCRNIISKTTTIFTHRIHGDWYIYLHFGWFLMGSM